MARPGRPMASACFLGGLLLTLVPAAAITVHYAAVIEINWYNPALGVHTSTDPDASVTVEFEPDGTFVITEIDYSSSFNLPPEAPITLGLDPNMPSAGTIDNGQASCIINWEGVTDTIYGPFSLSNDEGEYAGAVSGPFFQEGDTLELQESSVGTINPAVAGFSDWIHESSVDQPPSDPHYGTRIIFGVGAPDTVAADFDLDGDVDDLDLNAMRACRSGPAVPATTDCRFADLDLDDDVDQNDFAKLQRCISGDGIPANLDCE